MSIRYLSLIAVAAVLGCANAGRTAGIPPRNPNVITDGDIAAAHVVTAHDAIERMRPLWVRPLSTLVANVYMDGRRHGDLNSLRYILASQVAGIRYYNAAEGSARYGKHNTGGVIEVLMK